MEDNVYEQLFGKLIDEKSGITPEESEHILRQIRNFMMGMSSMSTSEDMYNKLYWMRLIVSVMTRLSLIASVWVFIFDPTKWYGILLFFVLSLLVGGVRDNDMTRRIMPPRLKNPSRKG